MEFIQFEPTGVYHPEKVRGLLIPTAMFGEGGILLNKNGQRFVATSPFEAEANAHKHDLDLLIAGEVEAGRGLEHGGVYFDGAAIPSAVLESYPLRQKKLRAAGIDLRSDRVEIGPVAHSLIGGVWMDSDCSCSVGGLFAAGEVAGGVHGANRMAGNGGAETIVFGKIGGDSAGKYAAACDNPAFFGDKTTLEETRLNRMIHEERAQKTTAGDTKSEIQALVSSAAGVIRNGKDIQAALGRLEEMKAEKAEHPAVRDFYSLIQCLDIKDAALLAEIVLSAALRRCESRGAHYRRDFPATDDERWRKNIIVKINADRSMGFQVREI
jgi:succinate dehydrogenase/fumarate reductase flavoprotein subunit